MTHLMDTLHYRGLLQVVRRDRGIRVYDLSDRACRPHLEQDSDAKVDALIDILVNLYAPMPGPTLSYAVSRLRYAAPQFRTRLKAAFTPGKNQTRSQTSGRCRLVLAGRREPSLSFARRASAPARALRSSGLGPPPLRNVLGLAVSIRSLHARAETKIGILRSPHVVAR